MARRGLSLILAHAALGAAWAASALSAQAVLPERSRATWDAHGITVRFPAAFAPHVVSMDTTVTDRFSGLEWRVVLEGGPTVYLSAFVIPPDAATLRMRRYATIEEALNAGGAHVRRCEKDILAFRCARPAAALVRPSNGELEVVITDYRWLALAAQSAEPILHLAVRRMGIELWSAEYPLTLDAP